MMVDKDVDRQRRFISNNSQDIFLFQEKSKEIVTGIVREIDLPIADSAHFALRRGMLDRISFNLGQGVILSGQVIDNKEVNNNFVMLNGRLDSGKQGDEYIELTDASNFTITYNGEALYGTITVDDRRVYEMYSNDGENCHIVELDLELLKAECNVTELESSSLLGVSARHEECTLNRSPTDSTVFVLVLYTAKARKAIGGQNTMEALINTCIQQTNMTFANSNIKGQVKLAVGESFNGMQEVDYIETGNSKLDLTNLGNRSHSILKVGHQLRDAYDADIISLIVENLDYAGIANLMPRFNRNWAPYALNVVQRIYAATNLSFTHELAHNMGAGHVYNPNKGPLGICDYSYGNRWTYKGKPYRSVMAYEPGLRVPYFSGPEVYYPNPHTEDKVSTGKDKVDNARTIRNTIEIVSKFRPPT